MARAELFFAENILKFVIDESLAPNHQGRNLKELPTDWYFSSSMRFYVRRYLESHQVEILNIFNTLQSNGNAGFGFKTFSERMSFNLLIRGYRELEFVQFSAVICKLAVLCLLKNHLSCLHYAKKSIVDTVKFYKTCGMFPADGWSNLCKAVQTSLKDEKRVV